MYSPINIRRRRNRTWLMHHWLLPAREIIQQNHHQVDFIGIYGLCSFWPLQWRSQPKKVGAHAAQLIFFVVQWKVTKFYMHGIHHNYTGLLLSLGPMCGTLFRPKLDNRLTIYYSSRVNWKHFLSSSPEPFCGSIFNEEPYKYSILLLLLLLPIQ